MNKENVGYTYNEIVFTLKKRREGILSHATTWMELDFMLSEISQSQKDKYSLILLI